MRRKTENLLVVFGNPLSGMLDLYARLIGDMFVRQIGETAFFFFVFVSMVGALLSCQGPTVDEKWESSYSQLVEQSSKLPALEQLYLSRKILSEKPEDFHRFCGYDHSPEVEFECRNILKRPHLLGEKKKSPHSSALWKVSSSVSDMDLKSATKAIQKAAMESKTSVAAICNGFSVDYLQYECYFIAADVLHQHHTQEYFERMLSLCEASGFYLSFCLSHIQHRTVLPTLSASAADWKLIDEKLLWLSQSSYANDNA